MEYTFDQCRDYLSQVAKKIVEMEKSFDSSMRGVWLDTLVSNYVSEMGKDFSMMFDYIMANQTEKYQSYGDIDNAVTKLKVTGSKFEKYPDYTYTATGIFLNDIFCDNKFVIIKVVESHKTIERFNTVYYHVRKVNKEPKTLNYNTLVPYGDLRDDGYVVSYVLKPFRDEITCVDGRGMAHFYARFKEAYDAIRQPYFELTQTD